MITAPGNTKASALTAERDMLVVSSHSTTQNIAAALAGTIHRSVCRTRIVAHDAFTTSDVRVRFVLVL